MVQRLNNLRSVWLYSDSQPTEILLAGMNIFLTPMATYMELGPLLFYQMVLVLTGIYQLLCVAQGDLACRLRASLLTFGMYGTTLLMYYDCGGLTTPTHLGWVVLFVAAFSSLRRIKNEQIIRDRG